MERSTQQHRSRALSARDLAYLGLGAALIALCSWLSVPTAVPFTMQTFAVCLAAALFGARRGLLAVGCYLLLGAVGLPVFALFKGGLGTLLGVTGGYLLGFLFTALVVGLAAERLGRRPRVLIPAMALGVLLCYAFGTAWFMLLYARSSGPLGLGTALAWCVLPYLPADAAKILLAAFLTGRLCPLIHKEDKS